MFASSLPDKTFFQICLIVDDCERFAANYREILGFDVPHDYQITELYEHTRYLLRSTAECARQNHQLDVGRRRL
ncbi:MAG: hypothetical protein IPK17_00510 [Chloroflexi bacterium]|uniref:hypothetical protein n=1 Tax=Candidatus Flexifilum breve TaxID=3140694 RepID=UPI00313616AD|nr:hypothetical protein [Chloroflexota bacterium]